MIELKINSEVELLSVHLLNMNKKPVLEMSAVIHPAGVIKEDNPVVTISSRAIPVALLGDLTNFLNAFLGASLQRKEPPAAKEPGAPMKKPGEESPL